MSLNRSLRRVAAPLTVATLCLLAACGGDDGDAEDSKPKAADKGAIDLSGACPDTVAVQTSWLPNATSFGPLFSLLGPSPDIDAGKKTVTAPLVADGKDTGVKLELRAGGPAIGYTSTTAQMYTDKSITLGVVGGFDETIQLSAKHPTLGVTAMMEKDPTAIIWDPETYPSFDSISDIGKTDTTVLYFGGDTYMEYLTGEGLLKKSQVDGSHDGSPARFVAADGKIAEGGFAVEDPYMYENEVKQWGKPVKFELVYDTGYPIYGASLVIRPSDKTELAPCLKKLVPIVQQAQVDYLQDPGATIDTIIEVSEAYKGESVVTKDLAEFGVDQMKELGLASNDAEGKDTTVGNFDEKRVQRLIDIGEPIFAAQKKPIKDGLTPEGLVTNEFIDPKIGFPSGS